ncbi:MAG TPA: GNAT family N-acetyltransferase [Spirillospora sp.]|nr:GNAT family N-acetyltransferase [Spirillospora sp.]
MGSIPETLITTYLEMTSRADFCPAYLEDSDSLTIMRMDRVDIPFYKFLYQAVGELWRWRDRLIMPEDELRAALADAGCTVDVLYVEGVPAGYIELARQGHDTEIAYFGLRPAFFGRGLGKHLLSYGVEQAWRENPRRVWVHTCNLDGPHALRNYLKRGFRIYREDEQPMPERYA